MQDSNPVQSIILVRRKCSPSSKVNFPSNVDQAEQQAAKKITKHDAGILYMAMRKIHYNVMRFNSIITFEQADVLAGRAKSTSAQFYVAYELDKMAEKYKEAWQRFGVNTDVLAIG
jgi:deferrochelatase/peroxidase EfeB